LTRAANQSTKRTPKLTKFHEELNRTFQHHRDRHRVSDQVVFRIDKQVAATLAERHPKVATRLVDADQRLARTGVSDAKRLLATLSNRSVSFDRERATESLGKARRALQQGDRLQDEGNHAAAIAHYRQAWTHAQTATDVMDAGVGPTVTITNRSDPVRNGSTNHTIRGTVFAVQPGEIDAVTVLVNGEPREVRIRPETVPGTTRRFAATVSLDARVVNLTVVAAEPEDAQPGHSERAPGKQSNGERGENGNGNDGEKTGGDQGGDSTASAVQTDHATLFLDGDGLPDRYETATTSTDPFDPDSDSDATDAAEAGDGTHDDLQDYDGDGLVTRQERALGTDPLDADTDDDQLSDQAEVVWTDTDPLAADSDGDGVPDAREDLDDDTLVNADEIANDADPHRADTDGDGLRDPAELDNGTKPAVFDTDGDGLGDDTELHDPFNTVPLNPDTDGDGILDGNETYTTQAANESAGAAVSLTGDGNAARTVTIHNRSSTFQSGDVEVPTASAVVDIESRENFSTANVTLQYDATEYKNANASDLAVFRYDPDLQTFVKLDSEVDTENHTVTAETSHFSIYTVIPTDEWSNGFDSGLPSPWSVEKEFASLGTWTCSGSCLTESSTLVAGDIGSDGGQITGAENDSSDGIGILCVALPGFEDCDADDDGIPNGEDPCPRTPGTECDTGDDDDGSGGGGDDPEPTQHTEVTRTYSFDHAREIAVQLRVKGSVAESDSAVYVELGDRRVFEIDTVTSTNWRTITRDVTEYAGDSMTVRVVADNQSLVQVDAFKIETHSDTDGIPDNIEEEGMPVGWGFEITTDPHDADTDGDGLRDDEEIFTDRVRTNPFTGERYYAWRSNPTLGDTDDDGLEDGPEVWGTSIPVTTTADGEPLRYATQGRQADDIMQVDSDPLFADTDGDGLTDTEERRLHTDPRESVTYAVTERHQRTIVDELYDRWKQHDEAGRYVEKKYVSSAAQEIGLLDDGTSARTLGNTELTDATGGFDFVTTDSGDIAFIALDNQLRTDTWLSNQRELGHTDPWDPDTDDDGLTDGQESKGLTTARYDFPRVAVELVVQSDTENTYHTSPTKADTDEDGYWDGWIGIHGVGHSDDVILYRENLRDTPGQKEGIAGGEIVPEQTEIHELRDSTPAYVGADIDEDGTREHSNLHLGERHWGTNPQRGQGESVPQTTLTVEVDWIEGRNPFNVTKNGVTVLEAAERNFRLYDLRVEFQRGEKLEREELAEIPKAVSATGEVSYVTPGELNRYELDIIEDQYHTKPNSLHLIWGTRLGQDTPKTVVDKFIGSQYDSADAVTFTNGAPGTQYWDEITCAPSLGGDCKDFGVMMGNDSIPTYKGLMSVLMHEMGHALSIGWLDDDPIPVLNYPQHGLEAYSGDSENPIIGLDETPEQVRRGDPPLWSIMRFGVAEDYASTQAETPRFAYSIEEAATTDFKDVPSEEDVEAE